MARQLLLQKFFSYPSHTQSLDNDHNSYKQTGQTVNVG